MYVNGRGFPSSDLTSDTFPIGEKIFLEARALKLPGRDLEGMC